MMTYVGSGPWLTYLPKLNVNERRRYEDLSPAVDAVLAYDGLLQNRTVSGTVRPHPEHTLYLHNAGGYEAVWEHWFRATRHNLYIPPPKRRAHPRGLYVHSWHAATPPRGDPTRGAEAIAT
jgi:hypothetical protein